MLNPIYAEAGIRIRKLRGLRRYTRERLAEEANISSKFLYEIETGKKGFTAEVLYRISNVLETKCDYILTGNKEDEVYDVYIAKMLEKYNKNQKERFLKILELMDDIY